ncbi:MOSC domain-containing protein [Rhodobacteraceae bacterium]|nr:MOSC domain-containing protein [Paracoccaceae bacterium]
MTPSLAHIYRHPIKSIGCEEINSAPLTQGRALPLDRMWGVLHTRSKLVFDGDHRLSQWGPKINFLTGAKAPSLMAVTCHQLDGGRLELRHPDTSALQIAPDQAGDQSAFLEWVTPLLPAEHPAPVALVAAPSAPLTDQSQPLISLINAATLGKLETQAGHALDPRRFRANLWIDGWQPEAERDLIGRDLRIGTATLTVVKPIGRCRATDANPDTGLRDVDMLPTLKETFGHTDLGMFCAVKSDGQITCGDQVEIL